MTAPDMDRLLGAEKVAIVGGTTRHDGLGRRVIKHLEDASFVGEVVIADPRSELGSAVDVAVLAVPANHTQDVLDRIAVNARHVIVLSSGFEEIGARALVVPDGTTLIGPNSVGLYSQRSRLVLTFAQAFDHLTDCAPSDGIFLVSQSGAFGARLARAARENGIPLDGFIGTGNETHLTAAGMGSALLRSEFRPKVLLMYLETVRDTDEFVELLTQARSHGVEVAVLYGGRSGSGAAAAASHTSALSSDYEVLEELMRALGVHVVETDRELLIAAQSLIHAGRADGQRVAIVTGSGGAGVVAADILEEHGAVIPVLSPSLQDSLSSDLPEFASLRNPVDVTAQAVGDAELISKLCRQIGESGEVDAILAIGREEFVDSIRGRVQIPVVVGLLDGQSSKEGGGGIAIGPDLDDATAAIRTLLTNTESVEAVSLQRPTSRRVGATISASESMSLFERAGIAVAPWGSGTSIAELRAHAEHLGWPVVLKSDGDAANHKALSGGVRLGVNRADFEGVAEEMLQKSNSVIVASQLSPALELFVGVREDEQFGLVVTAGLGGSHVELIRRTVTVPSGVGSKFLTSRLQGQIFDRGGIHYREYAEQLASVAEGLINLASEGYALVEANPLGVVNGELVALDARVVMHDDVGDR